MLQRSNRARLAIWAAGLVERRPGRQQGDPRPTLSQRFDPRSNSLSVLRLSFAVAVVITHAGLIAANDSSGFGRIDLADLAVDGFFVVSGFLVVRSGLRLPTLRRFAWHRALRILPGFWVCLVLTGFVVAPLIAWLQGRPPFSVLSGQDSSLGYVLKNAFLSIRQWDVSGLAAASGQMTLNGSLWTLWYEALCYVGVLALIAVVPKAWRRHAVAATVMATWAFLVATQVGILAGGPQYLPRFIMLFGLGAMGWLYADVLRFNPLGVVASVATLVSGLILLDDYRTLGGFGFAYLVLWAIVALPLRVEPPADLSYGLYVYHWPILQILVAAGAAGLGVPAFTLIGLGAAAVLALASWYVVEKPALAHKNAKWVDGGRRRRCAHALA